MLAEDTIISTVDEPRFTTFSSIELPVSLGEQTLSQFIMSICGDQYKVQYQAYEQLPFREIDERKNYMYKHIPYFIVGGKVNPHQMPFPQILFYNTCLAFRLTDIKLGPLEGLMDDGHTYAYIPLLHPNTAFLFITTGMENPGDLVQRQNWGDAYRHYVQKHYNIPLSDIVLLEPSAICWPGKARHYSNAKARQFAINGVASGDPPPITEPLQHIVDIPAGINLNEEWDKSQPIEVPPLRVDRRTNYALPGKLKYAHKLSEETY